MSSGDGGQAFPLIVGENWREIQWGMTLRQYAAIHLGVPESGIQWLNEMIVKANRDKFAGEALAGIIAGQSETETQFVRDDVRAGGHEARTAYRYADAMLKARQQPPAGGAA